MVTEVECGYVVYPDRILRVRVEQERDEDICDVEMMALRCDDDTQRTRVAIEPIEILWCNDLHTLDLDTAEGRANAAYSIISDFTIRRMRLPHAWAAEIVAEEIMAERAKSPDCVTCFLEEWRVLAADGIPRSMDAA